MLEAASPLSKAPDTTIDCPFMEFLGIRPLHEDAQDRYCLDFREEHVGNPLIRTFHGGILASFGEIVAAMHLAKSLMRSDVPECASMTFDYLRPAFEGTITATPKIVRRGRRITTVSIQLHLDGKLVSIGRFLFPVAPSLT